MVTCGNDIERGTLSNFLNKLSIYFGYLAHFIALGSKSLSSPNRLLFQLAIKLLSHVAICNKRKADRSRNMRFWGEEGEIHSRAATTPIVEDC